jgi:hypothetical protein
VPDDSRVGAVAAAAKRKARLQHLPIPALFADTRKALRGTRLARSKPDKPTACRKLLRQTALPLAGLRCVRPSHDGRCNASRKIIGQQKQPLSAQVASSVSAVSDMA